MADAGRLPGVVNHYVMFSDGGHLSEVGMYAISVWPAPCSMKSLPWRTRIVSARDTRGNLVRGWYDSREIPEKTARVIRETAWDILLTYPPAGVAKSLVMRQPASAAGRCRPAV